MQDEKNLSQPKGEARGLSLIAKETINAVVITDPAGLTTWVNPAFTRISGYELEEMLGKTPGQLLQGPESDPETIAYMHRQIALRESFCCEIINYSRNGGKYWVRIEGQPMTNDEGVCEGFFALQTDVSREKEYARERDLFIAQLSRNNADLKRFSYIASHNLRAPLANLMALANLLNEQTIQDSATLELFQAFKVSTRRLNETLNDLIDILVIKENGGQQLDTIAFNPIFQQVRQSINWMIEESGAKFEVDFTAAPSALFTHSYMESVFLNLLTNSIRYAHPDRKPCIRIASSDLPDAVQLTFTDNGLGFDLAKVSDRVFGLYQRFHHHAHSKGIGLYLVHSQITSLGGSIAVESEPDQFARFIIKFKK